MYVGNAATLIYQWAILRNCGNCTKRIGLYNKRVQLDLADARPLTRNVRPLVCGRDRLALPPRQSSQRGFLGQLARFLSSLRNKPRKFLDSLRLDIVQDEQRSCHFVPLGTPIYLAFASFFDYSTYPFKQSVAQVSGFHRHPATCCDTISSEFKSRWVLCPGVSV